MKLSSPHTNLALPRPSAAQVVLVRCDWMCSLTLPPEDKYHAFFICSTTCVHSLGNHLYVSLIAQCILAKVNLLLSLCKPVTVSGSCCRLWPLQDTHNVNTREELCIYVGALTVSVLEAVSRIVSSVRALPSQGGCTL